MVPGVSGEGPGTLPPCPYRGGRPTVNRLGLEGCLQIVPLLDEDGESCHAQSIGLYNTSDFGRWRSHAGSEECGEQCLD